MSKRLFALASILMVVTVLLGACGPKAASTYKCTDPLGCVVVEKGAPVRIAYALVVEGPDASLGTDSKRGIEIQIDDRGGKLLGHPIELVGENTGCNAEGGQAAATKLSTDKSIVAIVGTSCSSEARAGFPILSEAGFSMVSPSNTAPDLTDPAKHVAGYFRTAHNDKVQGAVAAEFAYNSLGARKAATVHDGSLYADQLQQVFANRFKELGGEIVYQGAVQPTDTDMRSVLTSIAANPPDILYYPIFVAAGGFITAQAKETPGLENTALMGADGMYTPDFLKAAGEASNGMYLSSPDFTVFGDAYTKFQEKYEKKYGEKVLNVFHAHAYDAAGLIFAAIEKVAVDVNGTLYIGRQALRNAIAATKDYKGLTGNLTCSPDGDCADPKIAVYQVTNSDPATWNPGASADSNPKKVYP
ncbi:MAG: branched-chain amino acid ABC transporter substrate-binding protein [Candidatus Villigracilaceae bacterium]